MDYDNPQYWKDAFHFPWVECSLSSRLGFCLSIRLLSEQIEQWNRKFKDGSISAYELTARMQVVQETGIPLGQILETKIVPHNDTLYFQGVPEVIYLTLFQVFKQ